MCSISCCRACRYHSRSLSRDAPLRLACVYFYPKRGRQLHPLSASQLAIRVLAVVGPAAVRQTQSYKSELRCGRRSLISPTRARARRDSGMSRRSALEAGPATEVVHGNGRGREVCPRTIVCLSGSQKSGISYIYLRYIYMHPCATRAYEWPSTVN